nr:MAG TPA: hypothetical protein [Caudoviricetes sp.]
MALEFHLSNMRGIFLPLLPAYLPSFYSSPNSVGSSG